MVYVSDKYVYAYGDSARVIDFYQFSLYIFSSTSLKLIRVYTMNDWERYHGFRDDLLKTDVLYWIGYSKLHKFYFNSTAYGLKEYAFNSDNVAKDYTTLMMKQVLVSSNLSKIIKIYKYYLKYINII